MQATAVQQARERLILAKTFVGLGRAMMRSVNGASVDFSFLTIAAAVLIGQVEGKPMSATKIAHYTGLPRSTVVRKLADFIDAGLIQRRGRAYLLSESRAGDQSVYVSTATRLIEVAVQELTALKNF